MADRVVHDALVDADHIAVEIDNLTGLTGFGTQTFDHRSVFPVRHKTDVLAVGLLGDVELEPTRVLAHIILRQLPQGKTQKRELFCRGRKQEVALVACRINGAVQLGTFRAIDPANIVARGERFRAKVTRGGHKIAKFHSLVAGHARNGGFAPAHRRPRSSR